MRRALRGLFAVQDLRQRFALCRVGALIDDGLHLALAFEYGTGPRVEDAAREPIESHVAEMPFSILTTSKPRQLPCVGNASN